MYSLKNSARGGGSTYNDTSATKYRHQTRMESLIETVLNTALGFVVSACAWPFVAMAMGYPYSFTHNMAVTGIFTALSVARGYVVRRYFEGRLHKAAERIARRLRDNN